MALTLRVPVALALCVTLELSVWEGVAVGLALSVPLGVNVALGVCVWLALWVRLGVTDCVTETLAVAVALPL